MVCTTAKKRQYEHQVGTPAESLTEDEVRIVLEQGKKLHMEELLKVTETAMEEVTNREINNNNKGVPALSV